MAGDTFVQVADSITSPSKGVEAGSSWVLTLVSSVANWMSGRDVFANTAHVWVVVAYFLAEYMVNWVRSYRAAWATEIEESIR